MKYHPVARTTVHVREQLAKAVVEGRLSLKEAAAEFKLSRQSAGKWVRRYRELGVAGLADRSSRPHRLAHQSPAELIQRVEMLRRQGWTGLRICAATGLSSATVSRMLTRLKLNKKHSIEPKPPPLRYEHAAPGDLLHLDIKRLVRIQRPSHRVTGDRRDGVKGIGAEFLHIAIDDHSRIAFTAMYPDQTEASASHFLAAAIAWFQRLGIHVRRLLTDNGPCYLARRFHRTCATLGLKHRRIRPYTPRTNGKAERFIQTALREWAYAHTFQNSQQRTLSLPRWTHQYNWHRPHTSLSRQPPITRSGLEVNNLMTIHT
jgi:transposase InsO family protein